VDGKKAMASLLVGSDLHGQLGISIGRFLVPLEQILPRIGSKNRIISLKMA